MARRNHTEKINGLCALMDQAADCIGLLMMQMECENTGVTERLRVIKLCCASLVDDSAGYPVESPITHTEYGPGEAQ